jgi:hypothetical protein
MSPAHQKATNMSIGRTSLYWQASQKKAEKAIEAGKGQQEAQLLDCYMTVEKQKERLAYFMYAGRSWIRRHYDAMPSASYL